MSDRNIWPGILITLFIIGLLIWLIAMARQGDRAAIAVLAVLGAVILILVGWGFSTLTNAINARREQQNFMANVRENLAIMNAMQRVQNQQNAMLLKQAKETQKALPSGDVWDVDALAMDDSVFEELEG
jgi:hypothetical protein